MDIIVTQTQFRDKILNLFLEPLLKKKPGSYSYNHLVSFISSLKFLTTDIIEKYHRDIYWDYYAISMENPNLTLQFILDHPTYKWDYEKLCSNPSITMDDIIECDKLRYWPFIARNPNLTMEFIETYHMYFTHHPYWTRVVADICKNPAISPDYLIESEHFKTRIDWHSIIENPNITIEFIRKHMDCIDDTYNSWEYLSKNPGITKDMIIQNLDLPWDYSIIRKCYDISFDCTDKPLYKKPDVSSIITFDYIQKLAKIYVKNCGKKTYTSDYYDFGVHKLKYIIDTYMETVSII